MKVGEFPVEAFRHVLVQVGAGVGIWVDPKHPADGCNVGGTDGVITEPDVGGFKMIEDDGGVFELVNSGTGGEE